MSSLDVLVDNVIEEWEGIPLVISVLLIGIAFTVDNAFGHWCLQYMWVWIVMFLVAISIHGSKI
jgi:hypothetical protein